MKPVEFIISDERIRKAVEKQDMHVLDEVFSAAEEMIDTGHTIIVENVHIEPGSGKQRSEIVGRILTRDELKDYAGAIGYKRYNTV